jgi:hypothetical protein
MPKTFELPGGSVLFRLIPLDVVAGVADLLKLVASVGGGEEPTSLHFSQCVAQGET